MLVTFFIVLFGGSIALLFSGVKYQRWLLCVASTIMSLVCATQAHTIEVMSGSVVIVFKEFMIVLVSWVLTALGIIFSGIGIIASLNKRPGGGG